MTAIIENTVDFAKKRYRVRKVYLTPRRLTVPLSSLKIDRPIFFLGVQGGGLTILHKCFQRLANTCFCHGNHLSWDASDNEMHVCITDRQIPSELSFYQNSFYPADMPTDFYRYWTYATNGNLKHFRIEPGDVTDRMRSDFRDVTRKIIRAHALDFDDCRYIDKSQLYTINLAALNAILEDTSPYFILIGRNPFGSVPRTAKNYYLNPKKHGFDMDYLEAARLCAEHWNNSFRLALDDGAGVDNFKVMRVEDFFSDPVSFARDVCTFTGLDYDPDMVPRPGQPSTIYQQMARRWYPLRISQTDKARAALSGEETAIINDVCGTTMKALGYDD